MSKEKKAFARFNELMEDTCRDTLRLPVGEGHKYVIFSDFHLGDGKKPDRFSKHTDVVVKAFEHYNQEGYTMILNGDIEDFHRFDSNVIIGAYGDTIFKGLRAFGNRLHRIFGNHDIEWSLTDPIAAGCRHAFEAVRLGEKILIAHGQQAEEWYAKDLHIVRVATTLKRVKEQYFGGGLGGSYSFTQLPTGKDELFAKWARTTKTILIAGHTHCPAFASVSNYDWVEIMIQKLDIRIREEKEAGNNVKALKKRRQWFRNRRKFTEHKLAQLNLQKPDLKREEPYYFNIGSGVCLDGVTNIEIEGNMMRMIYWSKDTGEREQIWADFDISTIE